MKYTSYEAPHYAVFSSIPPLRSTSSPQPPALRHFQSVFFPSCDQVSHPYKTTATLIIFYILNLSF